MKSITKKFFITAALTVIAASAAFADDQQLQTRLALERARKTQASRTTTVAIYKGGRGLGRSRTEAARPKGRVELRSNAHGQSWGVFVPANK